MFSGTTGLPQHSNPTPRCANYLCRPKTRYRLKTVVAVFTKYHAANVLNHILDKLVDNWDNDSKNINQLPPAEFHPLSLNIVLPLRTELTGTASKFLIVRTENFPGWCGRLFTSENFRLNSTVTKAWNYLLYIMLSSDLKVNIGQP